MSIDFRTLDIFRSASSYRHRLTPDIAIRAVQITEFPTTNVTSVGSVIGSGVAHQAGMALFPHILCPVDTSPFAARGLTYANVLAQALGAELTVLTVRPTIPALGLWAAHNLMLPPEDPGERERAVDALRAFASQRTGRSDIRVRVEDGAIAAEILRVADEWPAQLIALGTHGASGVDGLALGSVTERVLRRSHIPVMVVPRLAADAPPVAPAVVLCAVDRSIGATRAIEHASALARELSAALCVVHAVDHVLDEAPQFARHFDCEACYRAIEPQLRTWYSAAVSAVTGEPAPPLHLRFGPATLAILSVAAESRADLVVVGAAGAPSLFGSTARNVVRQSPVPVLVVPADAPFVKE